MSLSQPPLKGSAARDSVCVVCELPPPTGGMAIQAERLGQGLREAGHAVQHLRTNRMSPQSRWRRVKGVGALLNFTLFLGAVLVGLPRSQVVHIFSHSYLSFWLFTAPPALWGKLLGKRIVIHYHGGSADDFLTRSGPRAKQIFACAQALLVPSQFLVDVFAKHGLTASVLPNIMPLERFTYRERSPLQARILMARHLTPVYNPACGLRAFALLQAKHPEAQLTVAGDGPERDAMHLLAKELGIAARVDFIGNVNNDRMLAQLQSHDILLNTSRVDNQPVSLLEAFACGLPVVSTAVGGITYMIEHGQSGLLAPNDDHEALSALIHRLLTNADMGERITRNARAQVQAHGWQHIHPLLLQAYSPQATA